MNIDNEYLRKIIVEKLEEAIKMTREIDRLTYSDDKQQNIWRLSRDASLLLEDLKTGLDVGEMDGDE